MGLPGSISSRSSELAGGIKEGGNYRFAKVDAVVGDRIRSVAVSHFDRLLVLKGKDQFWLEIQFFFGVLLCHVYRWRFEL